MNKKVNERGEGWVNAREWLKAEFARRKLTREQIKARTEEAKDFINRHPGQEIEITPQGTKALLSLEKGTNLWPRSK
jgi:hypothetical protein